MIKWAENIVNDYLKKKEFELDFFPTIAIPVIAIFIFIVLFIYCKKI